jgi:hypothetical protein
MKRWFVVIVIIIISQLLLGCSEKKVIEFREFYSEVIGFSMEVEELKPIEPNIILMMTNDDFQHFKDKHFTPREIPMEEPNEERAVLYLQIPAPGTAVNTYSVESMDIKNKTLTVRLKREAQSFVNSPGGKKYMYKWVMLIEIDKSQLSDKIQVVIKK